MMCWSLQLAKPLQGRRYACKFTSAILARRDGSCANLNMMRLWVGPAMRCGVLGRKQDTHAFESARFVNAVRRAEAVHGMQKQLMWRKSSYATKSVYETQAIDETQAVDATQEKLMRQKQLVRHESS